LSRKRRRKAERAAARPGATAPSRAARAPGAPRAGRTATRSVAGRGANRSTRRLVVVLGLVAAAAVALGAVVLTGAFQTRTTGPNPGASPTPAASASPPVALAGLDGAAAGAAVDGISCQSAEQVIFHIHAHLAVYVGGSARGIPAGIGIAPPRQVRQAASGPVVVGCSCFYWLHSHTADGIIHIESPERRSYTLGNYFDIWMESLDSQHVGPAAGTVIAYVNGQRFSGSPREIPLSADTLIQLDVGSDIAPQPFTFPAGL